MEKIPAVATTLWCVNVVVVVVGDFMGYCGSTVVVAGAFFFFFFPSILLCFSGGGGLDGWLLVVGLSFSDRRLLEQIISHKKKIQQIIVYKIQTN